MTDTVREWVSKPPLDFGKVEKLRLYTKLTAKELASLCGVSRMTYYAWVRGQPMRPKNELLTRRTIRILLELVREGTWPEPGVEHLPSEDRIARLNKLVADES